MEGDYGLIGRVVMWGEKKKVWGETIGFFGHSLPRRQTLYKFFVGSWIDPLVFNLSSLVERTSGKPYAEI